ncbi:MAG: hypothetical protein ACREPI_09135 [Candidatus Dormibacterales bacterium]
MDNFKKVMAGLITIGALLALTGATMASFNAVTTNPSNVFANGTVTLTDVAGTVIAGSDCTVATTGGVCATLFGTGNTGFKPGGPDAANTATITYKGSLSTSSFVMYASNYTSKAAGSAASCTAANPASALDLQVAVGPSAGSETVVYPAQSAVLSGGLASGTSYTTLNVAALPAAISSGTTWTLFRYAGGSLSSQQVAVSANAVAGATSLTVTSFAANAAYPAGTQVLPGGGYGTLSGFSASYSGSGTGLTLNGGSNGAGAAGVWNTNDSSVFDLRAHLDSGADNTYQGCQSQADLDWYAQA